MQDGVGQQQRDPGVWTRYWRGGSLHSCGQAFAGNYAGAIAQFWNGQFAQLADTATVLDVGTGNGAIPRLAFDYAATHGKHWSIHGADLAQIDPATTSNDAARYAAITFHANAPMASLPFDAASVDLLTSQYALEYTDTAASIREFARVLVPGGRLACVIHRADSVVLQATQPQLDDCAFLFVDTRLHQRARELGTYLARATTQEMRTALASDVGAERARAKVNESVSAIVERIETSRIPGLLQTALAHVSEAFRNAHLWGELKLREYFAWSEQALRDEEQRLRDLKASALDRAGIEALAATCAAHGFDAVTLGELQHAPGMVMGWTLVARRA